MENSDAHTTVDLKALAEKYPTVDIQLSYNKFTLNQQSNNRRSFNEAADFERWILRDIENGWNLRAPEVNETVTRHCPNRHGFVEVLAKDEYKGVFCKKCDCQMVHKSELVKSELLPF